MHCRVSDYLYAPAQFLNEFGVVLGTGSQEDRIDVMDLQRLEAELEQTGGRALGIHHLPGEHTVCA